MNLRSLSNKEITMLILATLATPLDVCLGLFWYEGHYLKALPLLLFIILINALSQFVWMLCLRDYTKKE